MTPDGNDVEAHLDLVKDGQSLKGTYEGGPAPDGSWVSWRGATEFTFLPGE